VRISMRESADGIRQTALLSDLVEQARAHRTAKQGRIDRQRSSLARVGDIDRRAIREPQMGLVGVALANEHARNQRGGEVIGLRLWPDLETTEQLVELAVLADRLEVADGERRAALR